MRHLSEQELVEYYYSNDRDRGSIAQHVRDCAQCGASYSAIHADLSDLGKFDVPLREPEYGRRVWDSLADSLPARPTPRTFWLRPDLWRVLAYASVAATLLAATFYAGRMWEHAKAPVASTKTPASAPTPKSVVVVVLSDHLDRTERLLVELKHTGADDSDMLSPLRDEARNLLPANRICQREAKKSDDPDLENALAALDRLLTRLAEQPGGLNPAEVTRLQKQMDADGLLFEVRVLRSRMPATEQVTKTPSGGGKI
jgi:hypothetical protein